MRKSRLAQSLLRFPSRQLLDNNMGYPPLPMIIEEDNCVKMPRIRLRWLAVTGLLALLLTTVRIKRDGYRVLGDAASTNRRKYSLVREYIELGYPVTGERRYEGLALLANVDEIPIQKAHVPLLFYIPRSGGSTVRDILGNCYGLVQASDAGAGHTDDKKLQVLPQGNKDHNNINGNDSGNSNANNNDGQPPFVNVDTTTPYGIHRAQDLGLIQAEMVDFVFTKHLHPTATLFNGDQKAHMFTLVRDPLERAVSMFHSFQHTDGAADDPDLAHVSIEMYARSNRLDHNMMVRFLTNELIDNLTEEHLVTAKEILKKKCLVGLLEKIDESLERFEQYFGFHGDNTLVTNECKDRYLHWGWKNRHDHPMLQEDSTAYKLLFRKNELDIKLYEYAKELFELQGALIHKI